MPQVPLVAVHTLRDHTKTPLAPLDKIGLSILLLFTVAALSGYATFGRHPELLARFPSSAAFFPVAFELFARGHILVAFTALAASLTVRIGWRWLPALFAAAAISLGAELLGTATGFPFSAYRYEKFLGYRVAGLVPLLIPLSWFMMAFPCYVIACHVAKGRAATWAIGSLLLTTWDLTLDPAMSSLTRYWIWENPGPYYGMPIVNLAGWFGTGLAIMAGFDLVRARELTGRVPMELMVVYFLSILALSTGMTIVGGYWGAVVATTAVLALLTGGLRWMRFSR